MSYMGFDDEVHEVLQQLSTHTRKYSFNYEDKLAEKLVKWDPKVTDVIELGWTDHELNCAWPDLNDITYIPSYRRVKLSEIKYKQFNDSD